MEYSEPLPVTCPSQHPVGRQNPLYEGTTATGWFECEVCRLQYRPLPPGQETCDMDGYITHGGDGHEIYWHCEEEAAFAVRLPRCTCPAWPGRRCTGTASGPDCQCDNCRGRHGECGTTHRGGAGPEQIRLCLDHLEEVIE